MLAVVLIILGLFYRILAFVVLSTIAINLIMSEYPIHIDRST